MDKELLEKLVVRLIEMLEESTLIQGTVTLLLIAAVIFMTITEREMPGLLIDATMLTLGFWFGSKSQQQTNATLQRIHGRQPVTPLAKEKERGQDL
jgi:predicted deacylase